VVSDPRHIGDLEEISPNLLGHRQQELCAKAVRRAAESRVAVRARACACASIGDSAQRSIICARFVSS